MSHPRVVNVRAPGATWDIYVGRGRCPRTGRPGRWGNPFSVREHGRAAMGLYLDWLNEPPGIDARQEDGLGMTLRQLLASQLRGRVLGCWCAPGPCHAEALARLADGEDFARVRADLLEQVMGPPPGTDAGDPARRR